MWVLVRNVLKRFIHDVLENNLSLRSIDFLYGIIRLLGTLNFPKTKISYLLIHTRARAYQEVKMFVF